eukprot:gene25947-11627_t
MHLMRTNIALLWLAALVLAFQLRFTGGSGLACDQSGFCSVGMTKPYLGDVYDGKILKEALEARSFKNEKLRYKVQQQIIKKLRYEVQQRVMKKLRYEVQQRIMKKLKYEVQQWIMKKLRQSPNIPLTSTAAVKHLPEEGAVQPTSACLQALQLLPDVLAEIDSTGETSASGSPPADKTKVAAIARMELTLRGVFAGNIFDLGAAASAQLFEKGGGASAFEDTRQKLLPRPWAVDNIDEIIAVMRESFASSYYKKALLFV